MFSVLSDFNLFYNSAGGYEEETEVKCRRKTSGDVQ